MWFLPESHLPGPEKTYGGKLVWRMSDGRRNNWKNIVWRSAIVSEIFFGQSVVIMIWNLNRTQKNMFIQNKRFCINVPYHNLATDCPKKISDTIADLQTMFFQLFRRPSDILHTSLPPYVFSGPGRWDSGRNHIFYDLFFKYIKTFIYDPHLDCINWRKSAFCCFYSRNQSSQVKRFC